jgi:hypothetical protein
MDSVMYCIIVYNLWREPEKILGPFISWVGAEAYALAQEYSDYDIYDLTDPTY